MDIKACFTFFFFFFARGQLHQTTFQIGLWWWMSSTQPIFWITVSVSSSMSFTVIRSGSVRGWTMRVRVICPVPCPMRKCMEGKLLEVQWTRRILEPGTSSPNFSPIPFPTILLCSSSHSRTLAPSIYSNRASSSHLSFPKAVTSRHLTSHVDGVIRTGTMKEDKAGGKVREMDLGRRCPGYFLE